ncbi:MAG: VOC family protein [Cumulibacter sp.]
MRGIDHIGLTVPDVEQATRFFVEAFDAVVLYDVLERSDPARSGDALSLRLGVPPDTRQCAIRMLRLPDGPGIELFEYAASLQRSPAVPSDFGWQHVAFYVDDLDGALARVVDAGGRPLGEPRPMPYPENGQRNQFVYVVPPWGGRLELVSYPDPQPFAAFATAARWRPRVGAHP